MRQHRRVRLEPVPRQWLAQFVTGILRAVERLPFTSGRLVFGSDEPALDVRQLSDRHLAAGSRYEYRVAALSDADPAPLGYLTVRSWEPAGTTSAGTAATNLLATGDLVTGRIELEPNALTCTATYDAIGTLPRLAELLRLQARIDIDLDAWWSGHGNPAAAPLRAELTHAVASATLEVTSPILVDGRWEVAVTIEVDGQWWAQPLLRLALEYGQQILSRRYGSEPGELVSFEAAVDIVAGAWNDAMPGLTRQSPSRLADQLLADAVFDPE